MPADGALSIHSPAILAISNSLCTRSARLLLEILTQKTHLRSLGSFNQVHLEVIFATGLRQLRITHGDPVHRWILGGSLEEFRPHGAFGGTGLGVGSHQDDSMQLVVIILAEHMRVFV